MNTKLRVFEAFAGYGSQSFALERLSGDYPQFQFEVVGISEIDKYAIQAYYANHSSSIPNLGDISRINWNKAPDFDLFTYSFPCQDISSAGLQRGFSEGCGTRSSLLWECARAIETKRPRFLLMENVKALTQRKFASDFHKWRDWLFDCGYENYFAVLNAKDFGVPQNRERVFMVSILGEHTPFSFPKPLPLERRLKHVLEDKVDEKYWLSPRQVQSLIEHNRRKQSEGCGFKSNFLNENDIANAILTKYGMRGTDPCILESHSCAMRGRPDGSGNNIQQLEFGSEIANALTSVQKDSMVAEPEIITIGNYSRSSHEASRIVSPEGIAPTVKENHGTVTATVTPRIVQIGNLIKDSSYHNPHRGRVYAPEGISHCLNCNGGGQREVKILQRAHGTNKGRIKEICPTITTSSWQDNNLAIIEWLIRKLTRVLPPDGRTGKIHRPPYFLINPTLAAIQTCRKLHSCLLPVPYIPEDVH